MNFSFFKWRKPMRLLLVFFAVVLGLLGANALAASSADLSTIQASLEDSGTQTLGIMDGSAIAGGIVFFIASIFKFHRWKQNPQQVSIGQGVSLLLIGVVMIALPLTFSTAHRALLGSSDKMDSFGDSRVADIVSPETLSDGG